MAIYNTAYFRNLARQCEERCDWRKALEYYDRAIQCYPDIPEGMELLKADFEGLKRKREDVRVFLRGEVGET
jgi:tetratricopeptide (TPR) repeat protein